MNKLFLVMGKSACGKDTLYKDLVKSCGGFLHTVVPYTTRPKRNGEEEGREYHFISEEQMKQMEAEGRVIECRCYQTVHGPWYYLTADDGQINLSEYSSVLIVTLEAYEKIRDYYGSEAVVPLYIEVEDGTRLMRAVMRERSQREPRYEELCRRFLADAKDFSEERLTALGITRRYQNDDYYRVLSELRETIEEECHAVLP